MHLLMPLQAPLVQTSAVVQVSPSLHLAPSLTNACLHVVAYVEPGVGTQVSSVHVFLSSHLPLSSEPTQAPVLHLSLVVQPLLSLQ